jgi:hypothetical protein
MFMQIGEKFSETKKMSDLLGFLASEMSVSRRTVQRWCAARKVPGAYRTRGGHWRVRRPRGKIDPSDPVACLITLYFMPPPRPSPPLTMRKRLEWIKAILEWQIADEMEALINSQGFNDALEFSTVLKGICDDDGLPRGLKDIPRQERSRVVRQHFKDLEVRDPEKFRFLIETPLLKMIDLRAYEAMAAPNGRLMTKATKLRLNNVQKVTPENLARELGVSPASLYRGFEREAIKRACKPPTAHPSQSSGAAKKTVTINYNDEVFRNEGF